MKNLIVVDGRVEGNYPQGALYVNDQIELEETLNIILKNTPLNRLVIFCHGPHPLSFTSDDLTYDNCGVFQKLNGKVNKIILYSCKAAIGHGWKMCQKISRVSNATVIASSYSQRYNPDTFSPGHWEGKLYEFYPNGRVKKLQNYSGTNKSK